MSESHSSALSLTRYRRLSFKDKLVEARPMLLFFFLCFLLGVTGGAVLPYLFGSSSAVSFWVIPFLLIVGVLAGFGIVFSFRYFDRKLLGKVKSKVLAVEDRLVGGNARVKSEDLEDLVGSYLKLKRLEAADFYSRKLLELSCSGQRAFASMPDWLVSTEAWISSQSYHKGLNYKLLWLFETRGVLSLSPGKLSFTSKKISFSCHPESIVSLELKRHPLWLKPVPMRYISLCIDEGGQRHVFHLTPSFSQTDTVFDCNQMVDIWYQRLERVRRVIHPGGALPDWLVSDER